MQLAEEEIVNLAQWIRYPQLQICSKKLYILAEYGRREIAEMKQFVSIQFLGKNEPWNHIAY
jgi:hypothetical protein